MIRLSIETKPPLLYVCVNTKVYSRIEVVTEKKKKRQAELTVPAEFGDQNIERVQEWKIMQIKGMGEI